eukprot:1983017-Prymnesium_polylepis.1
MCNPSNASVRQAFSGKHFVPKRYGYVTHGTDNVTFIYVESVDAKYAYLVCAAREDESRTIPGARIALDARAR